MRLAILSDVHGNRPALLAVAADIEQWRPDQVVVAGDVVNRGPYSAACWDFIESKRRTAGWQVISGNHEEYILSYTRPESDPQHFYPMSYWTMQQLNGRLPALAALPDTAMLTSPDGQTVRIRHASMRGSRDGLYLHSPAAELRQQIAPAPTVYATGHTHVPFIRQVDNTLVVNAGSAGSPCDGDGRASYAQLIWQGGRWQADIRRVSYDVTQTHHDFHASGFLTETGPVAHLIYHEWRTARPVLLPYDREYGLLVTAGRLDEATAVARFLSQM